MKKLLHILVITVACAAGINAQADVSTDAGALLKQINVLLVEGKLAEVIPLAKKIVEIEKLRGEKGQANYMVALSNLARWQKRDLAQRTLRPVKGGSSQFAADVAETQANFREILILTELTADPLVLADAQYELAAFLFAFWGKVDEVESLYLKARETRESRLAPDSARLLSVAQALSELYFYKADFERFLPLNRRVAAALEKKFGPNDQRLVPALRAYTAFLKLRTVLPKRGRYHAGFPTSLAYRNPTPAMMIAFFYALKPV